MKCKLCNEEIPTKRASLSYTTCLACGELEAQQLKESRREQIAPAYNKGPLMYITSKRWVKDGEVNNEQTNSSNGLRSV